jgi:uncharacterized membrane protein YagU involved in acid resistance
MILKFFLIPIIAGSIATAGITAFMWLVNKSGLANADMVRAVGSLFTRSREDALKIGLIIHFLAGIIISTFYLLVLTMLPLTTPLETVAVGGIIGFIHGFAFSFFLVILAENHPLPEYQQADFQVAVAHILGHVVYGLLIGATLVVLANSGLVFSGLVK